jgi:hypothetical protein
MREHGLGHQEVERPTERAEGEVAFVAEGGPLDGQDLLAELLPDPLLDEPPLRLKAELPPGVDIGCGSLRAGRLFIVYISPASPLGAVQILSA